MKTKLFKKIICLLLALLLVLPFSACGKKQETLMELDGSALSMEVYRLMLSIQKGNMAYLINYYYGSHSSPDFWETVIDTRSTTNDQYYTAAILRKAKNLLSATALFDEMKLTLPDETIEAIDAEMDAYVEEFGGGSKKAFEGVLENYGFGYDALREYKIMNAKAEYASNSLYGKDG